MRGFWIASLLAGKQQPPAPQPDPRIGVLEQELRDIELQLAQIKGAHSDQPDTSAAVLDLKRSTSDQYADLNTQLAAQTKTSLPNGRLSFATPDGAFTLALRSLVQFDYGYCARGGGPAGGGRS